MSTRIQQKFKISSHDSCVAHRVSEVVLGDRDHIAGRRAEPVLDLRGLADAVRDCECKAPHAPYRSYCEEQRTPASNQQQSRRMHVYDN